MGHTERGAGPERETPPASATPRRVQVAPFRRNGDLLMSNNTFRILRSSLAGAALGAALFLDWPIVAGVLLVMFVLSL